jgi:hypothetical protein
MTSKDVARWTDRSDRNWPVEVVPAHEYDALKRRADRLEAALRAAHQYVMPDISRGPAHRSWCLMIENVEPLIGATEGRSLMRYAKVTT